MVYSTEIYNRQVTKTNCDRSSGLPQKGSLFYFMIFRIPNLHVIRAMCFHVLKNVEVLNLVVYPVKESLKAFTALFLIQ